jgi:NhaP-type Na+/H+ or K+/H+ antiporter
VSIPLAAERGFSLGDVYSIGLFFAGVALLAAIGALSHQHGRAFSASIVYLGFGLLAATLLEVLGLNLIEPLEDEKVLERLTELALIIALFGTGLKLDRPLTISAWSGVGRLLLIAMPLTIAAVTAFGVAVMGLPLGAALILGAVLAPTDPVLAGDVGVGPPGEEDGYEQNFSLTGEAGLNDGLAFPFIFAGLFILDPGGTGWIGEWLTADVLYAIAGGAVLGALIGYGLGGAAARLRARELIAPSFDGWLAVPAVLLVYGLAEVSGTYGFIAAFAGGLAFRRYASDPQHDRRVREGAEVIEKVGELIVILLLGGMLSFAGLGIPGPEGWLLVPLLLIAIRPLSVSISLLRSAMPARERLFIAWFGVRGIGSLYYMAVVIGANELGRSDAELIAWTTIAVVVVSILAHGTTASPLGRWLQPHVDESVGTATQPGRVQGR